MGSADTFNRNFNSFIHVFFIFEEDPEVRTRKIVKVVTQTMVNGKVVDESSEVEQIEERKKWENDYSPHPHATYHKTVTSELSHLPRTK